MTDRAPLEVAEVRALTIAAAAKAACPEGWGYVVIVSSFGDGGAGSFTTYVSNVERAGVVALLRGVADRIERQP